MAEAAKEYDGSPTPLEVRASDIFPYGYGAEADFLDDFFLPPQSEGADLIFTNPPFVTAGEFARRARSLAPVVALLTRTVWPLETKTRWELFQDIGFPSIVAPFYDRLAMVEGRYDPSKSSATAYSWVVWIDGAPTSTIVPIPYGTRSRLERKDDGRRFRALERGALSPPSGAPECLDLSPTTSSPTTLRPSEP